MGSLLTGIHHITAIAADPNENHDFYTQVLGQRLVKKTVNFDDPLTYHLYFGDEHGSPGTLLTHFPHPQAKRGVHGSPEILESVLSVLGGALPYWSSRLRSAGVDVREQNGGRETRLAFEDPHGMRFVIVESADPTGRPGYAGGDVEPRHAITGVDSVVIHVPDIGETTRFLEDVLGFESAGDGDRIRLHVEADLAGNRLDLVQTPRAPATRMGAGTVHHVAWRVPDDQTQAEVAGRVRAAGLSVTPVMDRDYFRSIYCRIPGGVIFEVATDGPGFAVDEPVERLGESLRLPSQHEPRRAEIEAHLIPLQPEGTANAR